MKEVLRLVHELGYSLRQASRSVRLCSTSVRNYLARAEAAGVRYEDIAGKSEAEAERSPAPERPRSSSMTRMRSSGQPNSRALPARAYWRSGLCSTWEGLDWRR